MFVKGSRKIQWRFFLSYLLMLVLPMLVGTIIYNMAYKLVEQKELEMRTMLMTNCMETIDGSMQRINNTLIDMMRLPSLNKLLVLQNRPGYRSPDAAIVYDAYRELSSYMNFTGMDNEILLYIRKPDLVFDGASFIYGQENYYNMGTSYEGIDYSEFKATVLDQYNFRKVIGNVIMEKKKHATDEKSYLYESGFLYINTLPLMGGSYNNLGAAVVHVGKQINDALTIVPVSEFGCTYITDEKQNLIAGVFGEHSVHSFEKLALEASSGSFYQKIDGQRMLVTFMRSDYNGWCYISMSPMNKIMSGLQSFQLWMTAVLTAAFVMGILLSFYFSRRNSKPLEAVLLELQAQYGKSGASLADLNSSVHGIIKDNVALQSTLKRQKLQARIAFFDSLFRGEFQNADEIDQRARYLGLDLDGENFCVMLVVFGGQAEPDSEESYLQTDIAQLFTQHTLGQTGVRTFFHTLSAGRLGVLLCFDRAEEQQRLQAVRGIAGQIGTAETNRLVSGVCCYAGGFCSELSNVCISFGEAAATSEMRRVHDNDAHDGDAQVVFYRQLMKDKRSYFYPNEIETKLRLLATTGDDERAQQMLGYLYEENFEKLSLSRQMAYAFFVDVYTTVIKIASEYKLDIDPQSFYRMRVNTLDCDAEFEQLRVYYSEIARATGGAQTDAGLLTQLEDFVRENYGNSEMCIAYMAQQFHVSETYFSQFFKRATGQIFSKYLETLRINRACALLRDTAQSIDDIAEDTGYASALSFRRAFKKVMGVSPSSYRQKDDTLRDQTQEDVR